MMTAVVAITCASARRRSKSGVGSWLDIHPLSHLSACAALARPVPAVNVMSSRDLRR